MAIPHITGDSINIKCEEQFLPEFPDLKIGKTDDDDVLYFDATGYIESKNNSNLSVDKFFFYYTPMQKALINSYGLDTTKIVRCNHDNHILIETSFIFLFICYVEPEFIAFVNDKLMNLMLNGYAFSDAFVATLAKTQLTDEFLIALANGGSEEGNLEQV